MTLEEKLSQHIVKNHKNIKFFAESIGMPYTTLRNILSRGVNNASSSNILTLCQALNISADSLGIGVIEEKKSNSINIFSLEDQALIKKYRTLDEKGKHTVDVVLDIEHKRCTEVTTLRIAGRDGIIEDKTVNKAEIDRALALLKGKEIKEDW